MMEFVSLCSSGCPLQDASRKPFLRSWKSTKDNSHIQLEGLLYSEGGLYSVLNEPISIALSLHLPIQHF